MRYGKIIWGLILIILGTMLILKNIGWIYFNWYAVFKLWPVLFIFWGISIIPVKEWIKLVLGIITLIFAVILFNRTDNNVGWLFKHEVDLNKTHEWDEQVLTEAYNSSITSATLKLDAAAGNFVIKDITDDLVKMNKKGDIGNYNMGIEKKGDSSRIVRIDLDTHVHVYNNNGNNVDIKLNPNPIWDMDFDIGAANTEFDLSNYRTKSIEIDGGAASINLKLGDKFYRTEVKVSTGASSVNIQVPKTSGCEVKSETFLVDKSLPGFTKDHDGKYVTENFKASSNKIYITIDGAISSFNVVRY